MMAPAIMMAEQTKMDHRLPNLSLMMPMKGKARAPPIQYTAAMRPVIVPLISPLS